jgi:hypothetical protein
MCASAPHQDARDSADDAHHVGRGDAQVEVDVTGLNLHTHSEAQRETSASIARERAQYRSSQIRFTDNVGAGCPGFVRLCVRVVGELGASR